MFLLDLTRSLAAPIGPQRRLLKAFKLASGSVVRQEHLHSLYPTDLLELSLSHLLDQLPFEALYRRTLCTLDSCCPSEPDRLSLFGLHPPFVRNRGRPQLSRILHHDQRLPKSFHHSSADVDLRSGISRLCEPIFDDRDVCRPVLTPPDSHQGQGIPPYTVFPIASGDATGTSLESIPVQASAGVLEWRVDFNAGANIVRRIG